MSHTHSTHSDLLTPSRVQALKSRFLLNLFEVCGLDHERYMYELETIIEQLEQERANSEAIVEDTQTNSNNQGD